MTIDIYTDSDDVIIDVGTDTRETPEVVTDSLYGPKGEKGDKGDTGEKGDKGDTGATGADGQDGEDGFSPIATVSKSGSVATITITDKNGTTTAEVYDGSGGGDVTDVKVNGSSVVTSGVADITLEDVAISGSYTDLSNTPTIPGALSDITVVAGNNISINGDTISATDTTYKAGSNIQISGDTISATDTTYSDFTGCDSITGGASGLVPAPSAGDEKKYLTGGGSFKQVKYSELSGTPTIPTDTSQLTNGAGFITGIGSSDVINALGYTPYDASNPSGYIDSSALAPYELKNKTINTPATSGTITLTDNSINSITPSGNITFTLPTIADNTVFHEIMVQINLSTVYTIDVGTTYYFNKTAPDLSTAGTYNLYYEYDKATQQWYCGALSKGTVS